MKIIWACVYFGSMVALGFYIGKKLSDIEGAIERHEKMIRKFYKEKK